jgi:putative inorganic carbon (HCO3(-)) transporter
MLKIINLPQTLFASFLIAGIVIGFNPVLIHFCLDLFSHRLNTPFLLNFYNLKRLDELMVTLGTAGLLVFSKKLRLDLFEAWHLLSTSIQYAICVFFGLGLISALSAVHIEPAILEVSHQILLFIFALTLSQQVLHPKLSSSLKTALTLGIGIYVLFAFYSYLTTYYHQVREASYSLTTLEYLTIYPQFINPRFLAQVFTLTWPLLTYLGTLTWKRNPGVSLLIFFINSYWITLGLENNSRAIFLSVGIALICLFFLIRHRIEYFQLWVKFLCGSALISFMLSEVLFSIGLNLPNPFWSILQHTETISNYTDRIGLWSYTLSHLIIPHPLLGVGPSNFAAFPNSIGVAHPHNIILKIASEWGTPAALIFCFILIKGVMGWLKFFKKHNTSKTAPYLPRLLLQSTLTLILISGLIDSMLSGTMVMPLSQLLLAIFFGWMYGICTEHAEKLQKPPQKKFNILAPYLQKLSQLLNPTLLLSLKKMIRFIAHHSSVCRQSITQHQDLVLTAGLLITMGIILIIVTHDLIDFSRSYQTFLMACAGSHHCTLPPLFWFPEQVSPLELWI